MAGKEGLGQVIYGALFKRKSAFIFITVVGAFFLEAGIDRSCEAMFNNINRGKLWHHIKDNYNTAEE